MTKTPQQIRNEVEKGCGEDLKRKVFEGNTDLYCGLEVFISEKVGLKRVYCDKCKAKLSILTEYDKSIKEMIEELDDFRRPVTDKEELFDFKQRMHRKIKQLLSKIGDNSEVEK